MEKVQDRKQGQDKAKLNEELQSHASERTIKVESYSNESSKIETDTNKEIVYSTQNLDLWYGENHALKNINLDILENNVTAIIGPSGCGKSTYIKTLNRMVELVPSVKNSR